MCFIHYDSVRFTNVSVFDIIDSSFLQQKQNETVLKRYQAYYISYNKMYKHDESIFRFQFIFKYETPLRG